MPPDPAPHRFETRLQGRPVISRDTQCRTIRTALTGTDTSHLHIVGPRGSGKTLLIQQTLDALPDAITGRYLSCIRYDTQYKVLRHLCNTVLDSDVSSGYHTSQLQRCLTDNWTPDDTVLVLDEVDFLLQNDGNDLLYYLSRHAPDDIQLVLISANHPELAAEVDDRTYSTLQPRTVQIPAYSERTATRILADRAQNLPTERLADGALTAITSTTTNIRLGLHWLAAAIEEAEAAVTPTAVDAVQQAAINRYHATLLADFTAHHTRLLAAVHDATDDAPVRSGAVYQAYKNRCRADGTSPLTTRRISTFLKHLELLGIIASEYHYGGEEGKTRRIRLQQLSQ